MECPEYRVVQILKNNRIDFAATLPCDRIKALLPKICRDIETIQLTREENGLGICAGAYLGGKRPVMVIQSTGIGNMVNAFLSLNMTYGISLPVLASWRGVYKESIEAQKLFGKRLPAILEAAGIRHTVIEAKDELDDIDAAIKDSFTNHAPHIVLISPAVWEGSQCDVSLPKEINPRHQELSLRSEIREPVLTRYDAIGILAGLTKDDIIISNLGMPSKELYTVKDREFNFYMLGSMGLASSIGLGLALAQERHVFVIDGDGSLLMNPNILIAIGERNPTNLTIVAIDNAAYGSTGNQETATLSQIDLEILANACGIKSTKKTHTETELKDAILKRAGFIHVITKPFNSRCGEIPFSAMEIRQRFMKAILGIAE